MPAGQCPPWQLADFCMGQTRRSKTRPENRTFRLAARDTTLQIRPCRFATREIQEGNNTLTHYPCLFLGAAGKEARFRFGLTLIRLAIV
ncbi:hypothetical protein PM082_019969 [Marasmius tenuissimus]|nr:hypothetical protein PM082_019969 [Marasmius tenuissimus]